MSAGGGRDGEGPLIFLVAGEPSGDQLGARLMAALKAETGGRVRFAGIGGERMAAEGLDSLFPMDELAVIGLAEVLPHLRRILRRLGESVAAVRAADADAVVTIDSPSFGLRVLRRLSGVRRPRIHYVAPQVWAWKPWRARRMAGYVDHLLALLPFEPPIFERHGLPTTFVGHPAVEAVGEGLGGAEFRRARGIPADAPLICLLPGSRAGEVRRLLPIFQETAGLLAADLPGLHVVVPTLAGVRGLVEDALRPWPVPAHVVVAGPEKYAAFDAAHAAIAASGTVAVELAVAGLPAVIAYRVNGLTAFLARRLIRVRYASLANLVLDREVQPELLQEGCTPDRLARALRPLLTDAGLRGRYVEAGLQAGAALGLGGAPPSRRAARAILDTLADWRR